MAKPLKVVLLDKNTSLYDKTGKKIISTLLAAHGLAFPRYYQDGYSVILRQAQDEREFPRLNSKAKKLARTFKVQPR